MRTLPDSYYEKLKSEIKDDGWIPWDGHTDICPLPFGTPCRIRTVSGIIISEIDRTLPAESFRWNYTGSSDIIAYKIVEKS